MDIEEAAAIFKKISKNEYPSIFGTGIVKISKEKYTVTVTLDISDKRHHNDFNTLRRLYPTVCFQFLQAVYR